MFGRQTSRTRDAERIAGQAWDALATAVDSAGTSARSARRRAGGMVDDASDRIGSTTREARRRANAAFDALAGRPSPRPWGWLLGAAIAGAVLGWLGTTLGRQAMNRADVSVPDDLREIGEPRMEVTPQRS